VPDYKQIWSL